MQRMCLFVYASSIPINLCHPSSLVVITLTNIQIGFDEDE